MFQNRPHDPLEVPTRVARRSVGPSWRIAADDLAGGIMDQGAIAGMDTNIGSAADSVATSQTGAGGIAQESAGAAVPAAGSAGGSSAPGGSGAGRNAHRVLASMARDFLAEQNTDDRSELLYRAQRHARDLTSTWTPQASQRTAAAFVDTVNELIPSRPRVAAAQPVTEFADFDDQLLF